MLLMEQDQRLVIPLPQRGAALFGLVFLMVQISFQNIGQLEALNRELGKLCNNPPRQAIPVCRLHAQLIRTL